VSEEVSTGRAETVLRAVLSETEAATVLCTDESLLSAGVAAMDELDGPERPSVQFLASRRAAKRTREDFVTATTLVEFEASETAALRVADAESLPEPAVVTDDAVVPLLRGVPSRVVAVRVGDAPLRADYGEAVADRWETAADFDLETFARSRFLDGLEEAFGPTFREDFERGLAAPDVRGSNHVDPVDLLVLFAAKHGEQSYELNRWGESFGVASVGKFSQSKRDLEDAGLIDTEKVESGSVGRPRQRLVLGQAALADADPEELVAAMRSVVD
jgi:hypothetical protein